MPLAKGSDIATSRLDDRVAPGQAAAIAATGLAGGRSLRRDLVAGAGALAQLC
jgi:hypothetical protein